ncbi:MAG: hypothetical protein ACR2JR_04655, partial [Rubrobacteraceae bacterium]
GSNLIFVLLDGDLPGVEHGSVPGGLRLRLELVSAFSRDPWLCVPVSRRACLFVRRERCSVRG